MSLNRTVLVSGEKVRGINITLAAPESLNAGSLHCCKWWSQ
jgi:hypothetical protein